MKITYTLSQLDDVAQQIISNRKSNTILFYGEMGDGKTTLIKALCKALGVTDSVKSPTYSIVNEYNTQDNSLVYHFDFYRIKDEEEVLDIGFDQYLEQGEWVFIEWPQNIIGLLPENAQKISLQKLTENNRLITID